MNVDGYLKKLGCARAVTVSSDTLSRIHEAHLYRVPFENLDIHEGVRIVLDEHAFLDKIGRGRGGFCYELNAAFCWLLRELGFTVTLLSANVWSGSSWGIDFDHMTLRVELDEPWLADVGFGDSFVHPLRLTPEILQHDRYRLQRDGEFWIVARNDEPQYRFTLGARELSDFQPGCDYHQSPASSFVTRGPMCSLAKPGGRTTLKSDRIIHTHGDEKSEEPIADQAHFHRALREHFGIALRESA